MDELSIYLREVGNYRAPTYYRNILPAMWLKKLKLPVRVFWDRALYQTSMAERMLIMGSADIFLAYNNADDVGFQQTMRRMSPYKNKDGNMEFPPSFVSDTDDDMFNVSPLNDSYRVLGYKRHDGTLCEDGDEIWIKNAETGEPILVWKDGRDIDFAQNRATMSRLHTFMQNSSLITCTTPACAEYVKREFGEDTNIHIFPNCVDFEQYPRVDLAQDDTIRILWQGSSSHWEDLWSIHTAIGKVNKMYPKVKWMFFGQPPSWIKKYIAPEAVEMIDFVEYLAYTTRLSTLNHDISLCPLVDSTFNRAKSAIKFYESSAVTKPAATLASNTVVFNEIIENETGLCYNNEDEFITKLSALIEDSALRKRLAENAKDWVRTNKDPAVHVTKLFEKYVEVRVAREQIPGPLDVPPKVKLPRKKTAAVRRKKGK